MNKERNEFRASVVGFCLVLNLLGTTWGQDTASGQKVEMDAARS